jgi:hypothetical protein
VVEGVTINLLWVRLRVTRNGITPGYSHPLYHLWERGKGGEGLLLFLLLNILILTTGYAHAQTTAPSSPERFQYRWVYLMQNLQVEDNVPKVEAILRRAKAAGYNGIALADFKLNILDRVPERYFRNLARVKAVADELGMDIYPAVAPFGYSSGILAHDPNLAEAIPVRDAAFVVRNGQADIAEAGDLLGGIGEFENAPGDKFAGWDYQDAIGTGIVADRTVKRGGTQSLRIENIGTAHAPSGNGRIQKLLTVEPFRQYHLSVWIKTEDFARPGEIKAIALPESGGPSLIQNSWRVQKTQDWTEYHAVFNSVDKTKVRVYAGVWGGTTGKLWFDDLRLTEVGLLNLVRRNDCPLVVRDTDTGTVYTEGKDYSPVRDEKIGMVPYAGSYDVYHTPPSITIPSGSRIKEGQRLRVSFWHTVSVYEEQVTASLTHPKVYEVVGKQVESVHKALSPKGYFLGYDEIRVGGWSGDKRTPGELLAESVRKTVGIVRKTAPNATVFFWSDMFDPSHNAHGDYYLVNGSWAGAWEGLPKDAVIVNWNSGKPKESLPFFANRGHRQILAGYYDGRPDSIQQWLSDAKGISGVVGVMYTT